MGEVEGPDLLRPRHRGRRSARLAGAPAASDSASDCRLLVSGRQAVQRRKVGHCPEVPATHCRDDGDVACGPQRLLRWDVVMTRFLTTANLTNLSELATRSNNVAFGDRVRRYLRRTG